MHIAWKGQACFFVTVSRGKEQVRIVIDPYSDSLGLKLPSMEADLVLVTHEHEDHSNAKAIKGNPFLVSSPGEYEVQEVFVQGIPSFHDDSKGKERGKNTIYVIEAEGVRLCHLGDLGQTELSPEQVEQIGNIDVLFVPVGGTYTITGEEAAKVVKQIEPTIAVPMHYALPKLKVKLDSPQTFLKHMGIKEPERVQKLVVKGRDLTAEETRVVLLEL